jgi:hypothetical protein
LEDQSMPNPSTKQHRGLIVGLGLVVVVMVVGGGFLLTLFLQGQAQHRSMRAQNGAEPVAVTLAPPRMKRPPQGPQVQYIAYFEPREYRSNADVETAAAEAARSAKAGNLSMVVTCHGDDVSGAGAAMVASLASEREVTVANILVGHGLDINRIQSGWGDPAIKTESHMTLDHPTCEIDPALPAN